MSIKPTDKEFQDTMNSFVRAGLLEVLCECGKYLDLNKLCYKDSREATARFKQLMKEKNISEKKARGIVLKEFMKRLK